MGINQLKQSITTKHMIKQPQQKLRPKFAVSKKIHLAAKKPRNEADDLEEMPQGFKGKKGQELSLM